MSIWDRGIVSNTSLPYQDGPTRELQRLEASCAPSLSDHVANLLEGYFSNKDAANLDELQEQNCLRGLPGYFEKRKSHET